MGGARFPSSAGAKAGKNNLQRMSGNADSLYRRAGQAYAPCAITTPPSASLADAVFSNGKVRLFTLKGVVTTGQFDRIIIPQMSCPGACVFQVGVYELQHQTGTTRGFGAKLVSASAKFVTVAAGTHEIILVAPEDLHTFELSPDGFYAAGVLGISGTLSIRSEQIAVTTGSAIGGVETVASTYTALPDTILVSDSSQVNNTLNVPLVLVVPRAQISSAVMT